MFTSPVNIWSRGVRTCDLGATEWETLPLYFLKISSAHLPDNFPLFYGVFGLDLQTNKRKIYLLSK